MQGFRSNTIAPGYRRYERYPVSCEIDGEIITGNYWIAGMILVVSTATGGTSRQLANSKPADLAKILLKRLLLTNRERRFAAVQAP
ncbi:hypothetical protein [Quatrionicoccus australiensis]|jgi:hypothetical protein|uniref:hypothetical protein n=1 Tax=Quatrionicoccus australiensis TaxID=138118 RepID=UPI000CB0B3E3|nr:hypothetical protein [Quatrionicoccus australiensis]MCB4362065.1 hypothetical protein [Quatrionicoccus australiensis]PKO39816.1 MAG: hypothetical protein CVU31_16685 [Betaproteobacteria bacterium HGW-Betaproteobacteria-4]